jgi:hypothetical protein
VLELERDTLTSSSPRNIRTHSASSVIIAVNEIPTRPGLAIKTHPKNLPKKTLKKPPKNPLNMFFGVFLFLIFYENNANFSL